MEFVTAIIAEIAKRVSVPVTQEIGYQFSYKSNVDKLKAEIQKLKEHRTDKQHQVEEAERNNRVIGAAVEGWLKRAKDAIAQADVLIHKDNEGQRPFPNLGVRRRLSKDAEKMEVSALNEDIPQILNVPIPPPMLTPPLAGGYEALESRTSILNEIMQALKDPNINRIGVHGMGGVGKTTLMKELAYQAEKEGSFGAVVMATITKTLDLRRIQGEVADGLGLQLTTETEEGRAGELRQRISREKSIILIILDDIWDELDLTKLGVSYGDDHKGCKLVLTSRNHNVLLSNNMDTQKVLSLEVLSNEESWNLFEKTAGNVVKLDSIRPTAVDVAKCCADLPLSIVTVAKALKNKDVSGWKDALGRLKKFDPKGMLNLKVFNTLKFSYYNLESEELKSLFLPIGCFEQGVGTEELLLICWGLDLYKDVSTLTAARDRHYVVTV